MPVDVTSRYYSLAAVEVEDDGDVSTALPARLVRPPAGESLYNHLLTGVEDVEYLAWRYHGDSRSWWRIADANPLVFPLDLPPGTTVKIPSTAGAGRVLRTRRL